MVVASRGGTAMRLESAQDLKAELLRAVVEPFSERAGRLRQGGARALERAHAEGALGERGVFGMSARPSDEVPQLQRSIALGVAPHGDAYRIAVRVQRPALLQSGLLDRLRRQARGEVDVRMIGRLDKRVTTRRVRRGPVRSRRLASIGHQDVTAGTLGAFVKRGRTVYILSNNHVLANEDRGKNGDWILQRGAYDGGTSPADRVARLRGAIVLASRGANEVDAAIAAIENGIPYDPRRLHGLAGGRDRRLAGLGPEFIDEGALVYKIGRTTGPTRGRVTAFDLDNVVVNYDKGNLRFDGQIEIEGADATPFSDGGDSGALVVNDDMQAVALLFSGGDSGGGNGMGLTYAHPLHRVLGALGVTLVTS
jgi:hypothetical protein